MQKCMPIIWSNVLQHAFEALEIALTKYACACSSRSSDEALRKCVDLGSDASGVGIGAVLIPHGCVIA